MEVGGFEVRDVRLGRKIVGGSCGFVGDER